MAQAIGNIYIRIGADTKKLSADLRAAQKQIAAFGKSMKSAGADLTTGLTLPILAIGGGAVKAYSDIEALQKGLIAVMGSAAAAGAEFEKLKEVAKLPGLGLEEAVKGSVSLQAAGFSADQAREALLQFGNALATVGKGKNELNLVTLALTQLQNKSSGFGQDLRQLTEQLPQMRNALQAAFGTADSEAIAKLGVTGKQVVETLVQEFAKLPRVTGGLKNAFENLSDSTKIAFAKLGEVLNKNLNIEGFLNKLGAAISRVTDAFSNLSPTAQKIIITMAGIAAAIGPILFITGQMAISFSAVAGAMKAVGIAATVSLGPVSLIIAGIAAAIAILVIKWDDISETMAGFGISSDVAITAFNYISSAVQAIVVNLRLAIDVLGNLIGTFVRFNQLILQKISFKEFIDQTVDAFKESGNRAAEGYLNAFDDTIKKKGRTNRGGAFNPGKVGSATSSAPSFTPKAGGKNVDQFSALPEDVAIRAGLKANDITLPFTGILPQLAKFAAAIESKVIGPLKSIKKPLEDISDSMNSTFKDTFESSIDYAALKLEEMMEKSRQANEKILKSLSAASTIIDPLLGFTQQLLDNQSQNLTNKEAQERAYVEKTVKNEDEKAKRLTAIDKKYDQEKKKLQRKQAIQNKVAGVFAAVIGMFEGVARALALGPAGLPLIPFIKALGLANIAAIAASPLPSLAIGTNSVRSDGLAQIHKGEAIVPAKVASGGFSGAGAQQVEVVGRLQGLDIVLSNKNSGDLYSRIYG